MVDLSKVMGQLTRGYTLVDWLRLGIDTVAKNDWLSYGPK
jgi:hypothetical protein